MIHHIPFQTKANPYIHFVFIGAGTIYVFFNKYGKLILSNGDGFGRWKRQSTLDTDQGMVTSTIERGKTQAFLARPRCGAQQK